MRKMAQKYIFELLWDRFTLLKERETAFVCGYSHHRELVHPECVISPTI
jgi:hypothetical protein